MKALIFGINGQDGYFLKKLLENENISVIGVSRSSGNWISGDVSNLSFVEKLIKDEVPDYIFHFAATSSAKHSLLFENNSSISIGTLNILESVRLFSPNSKVFLSGSALQFKNSGTPINEKTAFDPNCPYSIARIQSVYAGRYYRKEFGLKVFVGYLFNHDSEYRTDKHINKIITSTIGRIVKGSNEKLEIGNPDVKKEFNFAGDVINAMWLLVNQTSIYEAIIGSGKAYSIQEWIEYCFSRVGLNWHNFIVTNSNYMSTYNILVSDPTVIKTIGWEPKIDFYKLADRMMEVEL